MGDRWLVDLLEQSERSGRLPMGIAVVDPTSMIRVREDQMDHDGHDGEHTEYRNGEKER